MRSHVIPEMVLLSRPTPARMSQAIERNGILPHTRVTVTLFNSTARSGRATAGLPTRLVLSALAGLLSLLVVLASPANAAFGVGGHRYETAFEQPNAAEPSTGSRIDHAAIDLDESETHLRFGPSLPSPVPTLSSAGGRPRSDHSPDGTDHPLLERPPRA